MDSRNTNAKSIFGRISLMSFLLPLIFMANQIAFSADLPDVNFNDTAYKADNSLGSNDLPVLFLSGDSISVGYASSFKKGLDGRLTCVFRKDLPLLYPGMDFPPYPGQSAGLVELIQKCYLIPDFRPDFLMLNAGIHDVNKGVRLKDYLQNLEKLIRMASEYDARLIWIESTPLAEALARPNQKNARFSNARIEEYNQAASALMRKHGVPVISFYAMHQQYIEGAGDIQSVYVDVWHQQAPYRMRQGEYLAEQVLDLVEASSEGGDK